MSTKEQVAELSAHLRTLGYRNSKNRAFVPFAIWSLRGARISLGGPDLEREIDYWNGEALERGIEVDRYEIAGARDAIGIWRSEVYPEWCETGKMDLFHTLLDSWEWLPFEGHLLRNYLAQHSDAVDFLEVLNRRIYEACNFALNYESLSRYKRRLSCLRGLPASLRRRVYSFRNQMISKWALDRDKWSNHLAGKCPAPEPVDYKEENKLKNACIKAGMIPEVWDLELNLPWEDLAPLVVQRDLSIITIYTDLRSEFRLPDALEGFKPSPQWSGFREQMSYLFIT